MFYCFLEARFTSQRAEHNGELPGWQLLSVVHKTYGDPTFTVETMVKDTGTYYGIRFCEPLRSNVLVICRGLQVLVLGDAPWTVCDDDPGSFQNWKLPQRFGLELMKLETLPAERQHAAATSELATEYAAGHAHRSKDNWSKPWQNQSFFEHRRIGRRSFCTRVSFFKKSKQRPQHTCFVQRIWGPSKQCASHVQSNQNSVSKSGQKMRMEQILCLIYKCQER